MNKYELAIILDAQLAADAKDAVYQQTSEAVKKAEGKVLNSHVWLERQKMIFPIKKCREGTYYLMKFEGPSTAVERIKQILKLEERILRFSIIGTEA